jgi:hypothetical protein
MFPAWNSKILSLKFFSQRIHSSEARGQNPKMSEPDGFGPHVAVACATTKPSGWIFGQLFFGSFFFCKKKEQNN